MEEMQTTIEQQITNMEKQIKEVAHKKKKSVSNRASMSKEKEIVNVKLKEIKQKQKEEIKKLKNKIRDDIRKAEAYMAFLELRFLESLPDDNQEKIAHAIYRYIMSLDEKNKSEIEKAKKHMEVLAYSGKKIYTTLYSLLKNPT